MTATEKAGPRPPHPPGRSSRPLHAVWLCAFVLATVSVSLSARAANNAEAKPRLKVPDGFEVSLFADDDLAHNIYSMTFDSLGRPVVSGPGYVRILIDTNGDGTADTFKQFADGPKTGAQGMYFLGRDLICTGDGGLIRYRDQNADDRADGPPDLFLKLKTGGEHHAHSIQKGPDGWWYVIVGNMSGTTGGYATLPSSPIRKPRSGALLRLKPDLSGGEIIADGFRNAYDFAFNALGDLFTYDSDGERDVSLPWYRPTRVFHILPRSSAGWLSRSWKRPDYFLDMPPAVAAFGRGSPTGVVCYAHHTFPRTYRNALFVLDWTFGRVMALPLERDGGTWATKPIEFITATGQFGFAPTDAAIAPDGSLYISVGGRGTRGGVYRVAYREKNSNKTSNNSSDLKKIDALTDCLTTPQPLSSWSRARWLPKSKQLGKQAILNAAVDRNRIADQRVRAIQILTELFGGLDTDSLKTISTAKPSDVRAAAAWSIGRTDSTANHPNLRVNFLNDDVPIVRRMACESLAGASPQTDFNDLLPPLARALGSEDRWVRQAAARVVARLDRPARNKLGILAKQIGPQAELSMLFGLIERNGISRRTGLLLAIEILRGRHSAALKLEALRLIQLALGDVGPGHALPPVFDGYASRQDLSQFKPEIEQLATLFDKIYPTGNRLLDIEFSRLIAIIAPERPQLLETVLQHISGESHPVDDIHHLIVAARIPSRRTDAQRARVAGALLELSPKIDRLHLKQDSNWPDRVLEMYGQLAKYDPKLPATIVGSPRFGQPRHILFLSELDDRVLPGAIDAFVRKIHANADYRWNADVIFFLAKSTAPEHRALIRNQYENFAVRNAVLMALAKKPDKQDRSRFVEGLDSSPLEVLAACLSSLESLPAAGDPLEQFALLRTLRRLDHKKGEAQLRESVVKLLRRDTKQNFGFVSGKNGYRPQRQVVEKWSAWLTGAYPKLAQQFNASGPDATQLKEQMAKVDWKQGDPTRGRRLFEKQSCAQCHGGSRALGPDLAGVARRFSRADLFTAIAVPDRDVSPRYQTTLIATHNGNTYSGLIVYDSVDGVLMRNAVNQTFRIEADEIDMRRSSTRSLMPTGLLKGLAPPDLADLYAYIESLSGGKPKTVSTGGD